jgi:hypothetical protein
MQIKGEGWLPPEISKLMYLELEMPQSKGGFLHHMLHILYR